MAGIAALAAVHLFGAIQLTPDPNAGLVLGFAALVLVVAGAVVAKTMRARSTTWVQGHAEEVRAGIQAQRIPVVYFSSCIIAGAVNEAAGLVALVALLLGGPLHLWVVVGFALLQIWLTTPSLAKLEQALA
jgi:hypothetical protein